MGRQNKNKTVKQNITEEGNMTEKETHNDPEETLDSIQSEIDLARAELEATKMQIEEQKQISKYSKNREISSEEMEVTSRQKERSSNTTGLKEKIERQKIKDNEPITGMFMNRRAPGQPAKLTYGKYADDPVKWYTFEDGKQYTIPRGFADQINGGTEDNPCYYTPGFVKKEAGHIMDPSQPESAIHHVDTSNKKYAFVSTKY